MIDEPFNALDENAGGACKPDDERFGSGAPRGPGAATLTLQRLAVHLCGWIPGREPPGVEYYGPPAPVRETYVAFWWKASNPWQNHPSNVNAIADLFPATSGLLYIVFKDLRRPSTSCRSSRTTRAIWRLMSRQHRSHSRLHLIEWYVKYSSSATSRDGVTRWWVDRVLQGDYRDLQMSDDAGFG